MYIYIYTHTHTSVRWTDGFGILIYLSSNGKRLLRRGRLIQKML